MYRVICHDCELERTYEQEGEAMFRRDYHEYDTGHDVEYE